MKWIKLNKGLLLLSFFLPFTVTFCTRTELLNPVDTTRTTISDTASAAIKPLRLIDYLVYPTEESQSGFGVCYTYITTSIKNGFGIDATISVPIAYLCCILGFIFTFFHKRKLVLYLSILNICCFLFIITIISFDDMVDLVTFLLWGFWLAFVLSLLDVYLIKKYFLKPL